jgi:molybdopterin synthase catalytic subunit
MSSVTTRGKVIFTRRLFQVYYEIYTGVLAQRNRIKQSLRQKLVKRYKERGTHNAGLVAHSVAAVTVASIIVVVVIRKHHRRDHNNQRKQEQTPSSTGSAAQFRHRQIKMC